MISSIVSQESNPCSTNRSRYWVMPSSANISSNSVIQFGCIWNNTPRGTLIWLCWNNHSGFLVLEQEANRQAVVYFLIINDPSKSNCPSCISCCFTAYSDTASRAISTLVRTWSNLRWWMLQSKWDVSERGLSERGFWADSVCWILRIQNTW